MGYVKQREGGEGLWQMDSFLLCYRESMGISSPGLSNSILKLAVCGKELYIEFISTSLCSKLCT